MSNYPMGAKDDPRAPYNEPLNEDVDFNVSVICDITKTISMPNDGSGDDNEVKYKLSNEVREELEKQNFNVSEIIVIKE